MSCFQLDYSGMAPFYPLCEVKQSRMLTSRYAWTSDPKYSIWLTMMRYVSFSMELIHILMIDVELTVSGIPFGFGLLAIFQGSYQYMMDAYGPYAASAVSTRRHVPSRIIHPLRQIYPKHLVSYPPDLCGYCCGYKI